MGVKTPLRLEEANALFDGYQFESIHSTNNGITDTTYIVHDKEKSYILKKYEEASQRAIEEEQLLLEKLKQHRLNTPSCLASNGEWHLYTLLDGDILTTIQMKHLQQLARTMAKMHHATKMMKSSQVVLRPDAMAHGLRALKKRHFALYKRLSRIPCDELRSDGVIHGDLFLDNVLFDGERIGVIDFIAAGQGSFAFDLGVATLIWALRGNSDARLRFLLKTYKHAPKRISLAELCISIQLAAKFYTLRWFEKKWGDFSYRTRLIKRLKQLERSGLC